MPTKIPRTSLDSDLLAEAQLPQAPAPTPVILSNAKVHQPTPPFSNNSSNSTGHISNGNGDKNNIIVSQPEMPLTAAPSAPPLAPTAPLVGGSDKSVLETIKEPAPERFMMPEVTTILTAPVTDQLIESLVASSAPLAVPPPPAPTAPEVSSVSAVAPLATNLQDPSSTNTVAGATSAPVLPPIPTDPVFCPLMPGTATLTTNTTSLPNYNSNNYVEPPANGHLSETLVGIDAATASAAHAQAQVQAQAQPQVQNQAAQAGSGVGTNKLEEQNKPGQALAGRTDQSPAGATTTIIV